MKRLTFIDFFAGIGGFRLGLEMAGHKCIGFCEKDKFAVRSYRAMYDTEGEWYGEDITALGPGDIPYADIWTAGSPVRIFPLQGGEAGYTETEAASFLTSLHSSRAKRKRINPNGLSLKMLRDCFPAAGDGISSNISMSWPKQGMMSAGRFIIPKIMESRRTVSAYTLWDILEAEAGEQYYLSPEKTEQLLKNL